MCGLASVPVPACFHQLAGSCTYLLTCRQLHRHTCSRVDSGCNCLTCKCTQARPSSSSKWRPSETRKIKPSSTQQAVQPPAELARLLAAPIDLLQQRLQAAFLDMYSATGSKVRRTSCSCVRHCTGSQYRVQG